MGIDQNMSYTEEGLDIYCKAKELTDNFFSVSKKINPYDVYQILLVASLDSLREFNGLALD